ncbi:hypothetical protein [Streptomyces sp. NBC_00203]|uniref:hypothetical protein n=1 Tax=Streptomyces sp. NBC_00203 TaxID=2975680 RepID=UPI003245473A
MPATSLCGVINIGPDYGTCVFAAHPPEACRPESVAPRSCKGGCTAQNIQKSNQMQEVMRLTRQLADILPVRH